MGKQNKETKQEIGSNVEHSADFAKLMLSEERKKLIKHHNLQMEIVSNTAVTPPDAKRMLVASGFSIRQKVQVFDGQRWEKTGDIGDNECMWIEATITGCNVNDYKELLIEVLMVDGRTSVGYYKEGVRHCR